VPPQVDPLTIPQTIPFLGWRWDDLLFLLFGMVMLGSALLVVIGRNIIRSGLWMILSFASLAGLYAMLGATVVAAAQVLVYIGAISVLVLFAIMLTQSKEGPNRLVFHHQAWAAGIASVVLAVILAAVLAATQWPGQVAERTGTNVREVARLLFDRAGYVLPFEVVSVLLLAAVIGGVFLAKREDADAPERTTDYQARQVGFGPGGPSGTAGGGIGSAWPTGGRPGAPFGSGPTGAPTAPGGTSGGVSAPRAEEER
jgi:NADH-quinone oxidoreductase subunit J